MIITKKLTMAHKRIIRKKIYTSLTTRQRYEAEFGKEIVKFFYDNFVNIFVEPKFLPVGKPLNSDFAVVNHINNHILNKLFLAIFLIFFITPTTIPLAAFLAKTVDDPIEINGPTPMEVIGNMYSQPNIHIQVGRNKLDYYGSGDVNNDEKIDSLDSQEIIGAINDRADIDGDGTPGTEADKSKLEEYLRGERDYLPGHWNKLKTKEERISWIENVLKVQDMWPYIRGDFPWNQAPDYWVCADYIIQMEIDFNGISNIEEWPLVKDGRLNPENNARFNLPFRYVSTRSITDKAHAAGGFFVGDGTSDENNILNFDEWYFVNYYEDDRLVPGEFDMNVNGYAELKSHVYTIDLSQPAPANNFDIICNLVNFELTDGIGKMVYYQKEYTNPVRGPLYRLPLVITDNPNDNEVELSSINDELVNYQEPQNLDPIVTGEPIVTVKNSPLEAIVTFKDSPRIPLNENYPDHHYVFTRKFYAELSSGGITRNDSTSQEIEVKDMEAPTFILPQDTTITWDQTLDSTNTGIPKNIQDNSGLPVEKRVSYFLTSDEDSAKAYDAVWTLTDQFGNDSTATQKVTVDYTTGVAKTENLPTKFELLQNFPNPFNPTTTIEYSIPKNREEKEENVSIVIYDFLGNKVATIINKPHTAGYYSVTFDASNLVSGIYFYKLTAGNFAESKKMLLIK